LLFLTFGLLLFLVVTGTEYILWLSRSARLVLFIGFMIALLVLGYRFIAVPLAYLFRLKKGIGEKRASKLIGIHFPEVGDRLVNLLELAENSEKSELLLASIDQRSKELRPLQFTEAINFKDNLRYGRYLAAPIGVLLLIWISGSIAGFFGSYKRVVNYDVAYEPPAAFRFLLQNEGLDVLEDKPLTISVSTLGEVAPEAVFLETDEERMLMRNLGGGEHRLTIEPPITNFSFRFSANEVASRAYEVTAIAVPAITDFGVELRYPNYLGKKDEEIKGTGNLTIPEGTRATWKVKGINTSGISLTTPDTIVNFNKGKEVFQYVMQVWNSMAYELTTSNENLRDYENLGYQLNVIKDAAPKINVKEIRDTLRPNEIYFSGGASDDYGVARINLVYYQAGNRKNKRKVELMRPDNTIAQFYYTFPSGIDIEEGRPYELYFEVVDNDGLRGGKIGTSQVFQTLLLDDKILKKRRLENQESLIEGLDKSLEDVEKQSELLKEINLENKQDGNLDYKDKERIKGFLEQQQRQEGLMEKFSKELKDNLEKEERSGEMNELLKERLERQEREAKKNQELLKALEEVADKIEKEDLKKRLEELAKSQNSGKRSLEQLVELTKRYYVTEKAAQLGKELDELSKEQEAVSDRDIDEKGSKEEQKKLNESFEEISKELEELKGDNRALRKPLDMDYNRNDQESIKNDQEDALEEIEKYQDKEDGNFEEEEKRAAQNKTSQKQKSAAQKMKELSDKMKQGMSGAGGASGMVEDAEMLRQILDNLITFSFKQEGLLEKVNGNDIEIGDFSSTVREQKELRQLFEHVDDSLFALSLRRAELSEFVNEQITEVYYNVDKTLESIAENQMYQAASYQQYVLGASNALADFLAGILDNMQQSMMSGQGQGQGQGFQLPDIIKKQGELKEKMQGGSESGNKGQQNQGEEGEQSKGERGGDEGKEGDKGGEQNNGEGGKRGKGSKGEEEDNGDGQGGSYGGNGQQMSENELKEIYEIYQEQQTLRKALEQQLENIIEADKRDVAKKLLLQMEQFENELLENGITKRTSDRMNQIQHQLMKLEDATLKQGKKTERESNTNEKDFSAPILTKPELLKPEGNEFEILNRQALPLRPVYQNRVREYFDHGNQF